jgi:hypothetical protein
MNFINKEKQKKIIEIEYDEETEIKLNEVYKEQTKMKLESNTYWKKHLYRMLVQKNKRKTIYQRLNKKKYLFDIDRVSDFNYSFHLDNNLFKYDSAIPKLLEDKNKFNQLSFFNFADQSQSAINYQVKNFFKTNTEIMTKIDYPSDMEISIKESDGEKEITEQDKFLGNKRKSSDSYQNNELVNNIKDEKEKK